MESDKFSDYQTAIESSSWIKTALVKVKDESDQDWINMFIIQSTVPCI